MKCEKCGKELSEYSNFCRFCGNPVAINETKLDVKNDLTDKIDIDKIDVEKLRKENVVDDDLNDITEDLDMKVDAMKEISKTQSFSLNVSDKREKNSDSCNINNDTEDILNIEFMPGTLNKIDIESTNQLEKILLTDDNENKEDLQTKLIPDSVINLKIEKQETSLEQSQKNGFIEEKIMSEKDKKDDIKIIDKDEVENNNNKEIFEKIESKPEDQNISPIINSVFDNEITETKKGKGCIVFAILFPLIIILLLSAIWLYKTNLQLDKENKDNQNKIDSLEKELTSISEKDIELDSQSYIYNGHKIKFLKDYNYEIVDDMMVISNDKYQFFTIMKDEKYSNIKSDMDFYESLIIEQDYNVNSHGTKVIDDREYVFFETTDSENNNNLIVYTKLFDDSVIALFVKFERNTIDYDFLIEYNNIVDSFDKVDSIEALDFSFFEKN